jgi:hypothetical protein
MSTLVLLLLFAVTNIDLDMISVPLTNVIRIGLTMGGRGELRREGTVTRIKLDIDKIAGPAALGPALNTYVVWAVTPEGIFDNLGELEIKGTKAQFGATTPFTQFGILITAEPHYMVDKPSSAVVYRSQNPETELRRKVVPIEVGAYDYSQLKAPGSAPYSIIVQARTAFQVAQATGAASLAPADFRNAQVALGAMEELVTRASPLDILWPTANEAIRWSQRSATAARAAKR